MLKVLTITFQVIKEHEKKPSFTSFHKHQRARFQRPGALFCSSFSKVSDFAAANKAACERFRQLLCGVMMVGRTEDVSLDLRPLSCCFSSPTAS